VYVPDRSETEWATIGHIVAPFGIRGELKVYSMSDIPNRFAQLETVYLGPEHAPRRILAARPHKGAVIVLRLQGVDDANMAETLRNVVLMIPAHQLAELPADIYYHHDILGLQVITLQGRVVGTIVDILETGGNDVYVIRDDDGGGKDILIPAIKDVVKQVDLARRMMYIDPIQGLLNTDEAESDLPEKEDE
jgi:16S rRNA processing protein RimM